MAPAGAGATEQFVAKLEVSVVGLGLGQSSLDLGQWRFWMGRTRLVVTGAYRPGLSTKVCQQLGRGSGSQFLYLGKGARGHGHSPLEGLDPNILSAPAAHHDDLGQACCGTQWSKNLRAALLPMFNFFPQQSFRSFHQVQERLIVKVSLHIFWCVTQFGVIPFFGG